MRNRIRSFPGCDRRRLLFALRSWLFWRQLLFLLRQLFFLLRFLLGFSFSFFLALRRRLLRSQNGVQRVAFLPRTELHNTLRFHVLDQPLQNLAAQPGAGHFAAAEEDRGLYFVASIKEAEHVILFGLVIVVVHIDAELDLFYGDRLLVLFGLALFFFLLVQVF